MAKLVSHIATFVSQAPSDEARARSATLGIVSSAKIRPEDLVWITDILVPKSLRKRIAESEFAHLLVVPDGALHQLAFEALPTDVDRTTYLFDLLPPICYAPSLKIYRQLQEYKTSVENQAAMLSVADPLYRQALLRGFADWRLKIDGLVERPTALTLAELRALPSRTQITRHDCVEGWSAIGKWTGVQLGPLLQSVGLKPEARYLVFHCADKLGPSGNYLPKFGPYLKSGEGNTWGDSVNLDGPGSDDVRRYILENAAMWLREYHVDGLRLDAVHALKDERAVHILEEFGALGDQVESETGIPRTMIAESDLNNPRLIYPRNVNGYGLEGQWSDDFHHALHVNLSGETTGYYSDFDSLAVLAKVLEHGFLHDGSYSSFRERHHGRPIRQDLAHPSALVVCLQNHDQIGNRATGDRLTSSLSDGKLAIGAVVTMTSPFTPKSRITFSSFPAVSSRISSVSSGPSRPGGSARNARSGFW